MAITPPKEPEQGRWHRFVFRYTPTIILAEPFQCFLMVYGMAIGIGVLNGALLNPTKPEIYQVLPLTVLILWASAFFVGSALMGFGLFLVSRLSALSPKDRRWELIGLCIIGTATLVYGLAAPLRLPHETLYDWIQVGVSVSLALSLFVAIVVRATIITSSVFLLAVSRLTRVRLIKEIMRKK